MGVNNNKLYSAFAFYVHLEKKNFLFITICIYTSSPFMYVEFSSEHKQNYLYDRHENLKRFYYFRVLSLELDATFY